MWNDRIDLMALVSECLAVKGGSKMGLIVDTLIAKGYHRCDKDERKKMDSRERSVAKEMIAESEEAIKYYKRIIDELLEDAEDDYYREKVAFKGEQIRQAEAAIRTLESLLSRSAE